MVSVRFLQLSEHRSFLFMKASKFTVKRTGKIPRRVLCFPGPRNNWEMNNEISTKTQFKLSKQKGNRTGASPIFQTFCKLKNGLCTFYISNRLVILNDQLTQYCSKCHTVVLVSEEISSGEISENIAEIEAALS